MIQQYKLVGRLETGELAELYRAQREGASSVIIKLFHPRTSDVAYAQAVAETARRLNDVAHPGVAHVLELGLVKRRLAVVREDVGRFNLGTALQRLNTKEVLLAPALALTWMIDLLELVHQAHVAGVIHGALTPGNVMLAPDGSPAVCDFGALAALNSVPWLRKNFGARGRNNYRAPEITQHEEVSVQSDLYSLGAITYELLTLREPSAGAATMSTRREHVPPPSRLDRRINSRLDPIVLRAIDAVPSRRFKSCADFAEALRDFLSNSGGLPSKDDLKRFTQELFPKEVNADAMGPVPFDDTFGLKEVDGAELEQTDERSILILARKAFSGGEVSPTAETSEAMPAFLDFQPEPSHSDRRATEEIPEVRDRSSLSWDAPPSAAPVARKAPDALQANAAAVQKRMRIAQDYERTPDPTQPVAKPLVDDPKDLVPPKVKQAPATIVEMPSYAATPAESQPIDGRKLVRDSDGRLRRMITEERSLEATRKRQAKMMVLAGTFAIVGFVIFGGAVWMRGQGLIGAPVTRPVVRDPPPRPPEPRPAPVIKPSPPGPKIDCYDGVPKKGAALLTVVTKVQIKVDLDGQRLCTLVSVTLSPGPHTVVITDLKTGVKEELKLRFVAGEHKKVVAQK